MCPITSTSFKDVEYAQRKVRFLVTGIIYVTCYSKRYLNGSQLAKMKKSIPGFFYRDEAVGLKSCKYT